MANVTCSGDWYLAVWNISEGLHMADVDMGNPLMQYTWHESFSTCVIGGLIFRLYHLLSTQIFHVLAIPFGWELGILLDTSWTDLLRSLYGRTLFKLLHILSQRICRDSAAFIECKGKELLETDLTEQLERVARPLPMLRESSVACSHEDVMARIGAGHEDPFNWESWVKTAQQSARCATERWELLELLGTNWRIFQALLGLPVPGLHSFRDGKPPHSKSFAERLTSAALKVEGQWCGDNPRASAVIGRDLLLVHALGATVHQTPGGRRVLELALYFERVARELEEACDSWEGSYWFRLQCTFRGQTSTYVRDASMLSGLTWMQPRKSNLVSCVVPEGVEYPFLVEVDRKDDEFEAPLQLELCALEEPASIRATVCTEPLHSLKGSRKVSDLVEHHLKLGFHVDLYDSDGSGEHAYDHFRHTGRVKYFPNFVQYQYGSRLGSTEAAGLNEPAAGCSVGMQEMHCLFRNRGRSRWVAPRLDPDEYFYFAKEGKDDTSVVTLFERFGDASHLLLDSLEFGGTTYAEPDAPVVERFFMSSGILNPQVTLNTVKRSHCNDMATNLFCSDMMSPWNINASIDRCCLCNDMATCSGVHPCRSHCV
eukprot:TRINITY_DN31029_c0_g1_i3.p1 TRINITY_DN31029_c0_g1~~TRINITY_DN31029_c0_g1_i3.p1  ORF type:complete len:599 (-),score=65.40 TRINITY_DN31029_c0_g1_i3:383-2179(-)